VLRIVAAFRGRPAWRLRPPKSRVSWCVICGGDVMATDVAGEGSVAVPLGRAHVRRLLVLTWRCPACGGLTGGDRLDGDAYPDMRLLPVAKVG